MKKFLKKSSGKYLHQNIFLNNVAGLLYQKRGSEVFYYEFCKMFKNAHFYKTSPVIASGFNNTRMEELVLYRKNSLKYKVGCF